MKSGTKYLRRDNPWMREVFRYRGQFPGPTLEARSGDTIIIEVQNEMQDEGVAIHWHGLRMEGANDMDGAVGITQNPIPPSSEFTYKFRIADNQAGTFWYHSHSGIQRADGLYGGLIVHKPHAKSTSDPVKYQYEEEGLLLIGDWYHRPATEVEQSYANHESWGREPVPDSLLINGFGAFNCSMAVPSRPLDCVEISAPGLKLRHTRTRLRVVNAGGLSGFVLSTPDCHVAMFQVDGGNEIEESPKSSSIGILYPGERIDLILECDATSQPAGYPLTITLDAENFAIQNKALTLTHHFSMSPSPNTLSQRGHPYVPPSIEKGEGFFDLATAKGAVIRENTIQDVANQTILLYTKMEILARLGNVPVGIVNRTTWSPQTLPSQPLVALSRAYWNSNQLVPFIPLSREPSNTTWVDIVVNNLDEKGHPFHLHGYDFYILSQYYPTVRGYHAYNPFSYSTLASSPSPPGGPYNLFGTDNAFLTYVAGYCTSTDFTPATTTAVTSVSTPGTTGFGPTTQVTSINPGGPVISVTSLQFSITSALTTAAPSITSTPTPTTIVPAGIAASSTAKAEGTGSRDVSLLSILGSIFAALLAF
ncbi:hypothetical protein G7Y89_g1 [Cudoniella acicularis]|uniref:Laccase n=1 Tax=Cudoniella acicularis TaxID=354080 RepID=A0A8H4RYZ9_9HELO|nr:hypothetical protein G7Y89_g1 [Cudoniella acicularis]